MRFSDAINKNSFAAYFRCTNTINCCVITLNGSEMVNLMEENNFDIQELDGKRIKVSVFEKTFILEDAIRTIADASGRRHWMHPRDEPQQLVNLLP